MLPEIFYWTSASQNTRRFVGKIPGAEGARLIGKGSGGPGLATRPFVLIMPTYAGHDGIGAVPKPVISLLNIPENRALLLGVIGGGNRNFGAMFAIGARVVAEKCDVPLLWRFELAGTERDAAIVHDGLLRLGERVTA